MQDGYGYTNKTKIGNWSEEQEQEKARLKEYLKKKEKGLLTTQQLASYSEKISLTESIDGNIREGDLFMLCSSHNKGVLSLDLGTEIPSAGGPARYSSSTSPTYLPCARNVFTIKKVTTDPSDPVIKYGDKVVFTTTTYLKSAAKIQNLLCLSSQLVSSSVFAKYSRFQEVSFTAEAPSAYGTHWQILYHDPKFRVEYEGSPIQIGKPVIINHCKTNAHLGSSSVSYLNDFGTENEVFAHTVLDQHKVEQPENLWIFGDASLHEILLEGEEPNVIFKYF